MPRRSMQSWVTSPQPQGPRVFTVGVPVGAACGRAAHVDAHVNTTDHVDATFPASGCSTPLRPAEHLLAFFFFQIASCP